MKPGTKSKPTKLKVVSGVSDQQRLNHTEPEVDQTLPIMPEWVTGYAAEIWARLADKLHDAGVLTFVDRDVLAMYCQLMSAFRDAVTDADVNKQVKLSQQVRILAAELGMTPSSRSSLHVNKPKGNNKSQPRSAILTGGGK